MDFSFAFTPDLLAIFATLFVLELVLGVDNIIFISILTGRLPKSQQNKARIIGLTLAMLLRILLVLVAGWIITLENELFTVFGVGFSGKELILIGGGGFLIFKAVKEIHQRVEGHEEATAGAGTATFGAVLLQILLMDLVFSLDSVITAVGMTQNMVIIIAAVVLSFGLLLFAAKAIAEFVNKHPTVKMLALSFLLLIGVFLVAEGFGFHIDKAFVYGPMAFAALVEGLNLWASGRAKKRREAREGAAAEPSETDSDAAPSLRVDAYGVDPNSIGRASKPKQRSDS